MAMVKCAFCGGSGVSDTGAFCPACKGKGEVKVEQPYKTCPACDGTGKRRPPRRLSFCIRCKGVGVIPAKG